MKSHAREISDTWTGARTHVASVRGLRLSVRHHVRESVVDEEGDALRAVHDEDQVVKGACLDVLPLHLPASVVSIPGNLRGLDLHAAVAEQEVEGVDAFLASRRLCKTCPRAP